MESARSTVLPERAPKALFLAFGILVMGIVTSGYLYYRHYEKEYRVQVERQLSAVAELKVRDLVDWRTERLADGELFRRNPVFSSLVSRSLKNPRDAEARRLLSVWLGQLRTTHQYYRLILLDDRGVARLSVPDSREPSNPDLARHAAEVLRSGQVAFLDFHRSAEDGPVRIAVMAPVLGDGENGPPLGVIVLLIDPATYFYPSIQRWPVPSATSEIMLLRMDANDALYLNDLRFRPHAALALRRPLTRVEVPAVRAVLGYEGILDGPDYRGVPVVAAARTVPGSPWFLVAKMDASELFAPLRERLWAMVVLVGALVISVGAAIGWLWRQRSERVYRELYEGQRERDQAAEAVRETEVKFRAVFEHSSVGNSLTSPDGRLLEVNHTFATMLGYTVEAMATLDIATITHRDDVAESRECIRCLLAGERPTYSMEKRYIRRDGSFVWTSVSTALLRREDGAPRFFVASIQDITDRKHAETALRSSEERFRLVAESVTDVVFEWNLKDAITWYGDIDGLMGYSAAEFPRTFDAWAAAVHPDDIERTRHAVQAHLRGESPYDVEYRIVTKDGACRWWSARGTVLRDETGEPGRMLGAVTDITARKEAEQALKLSEKKYRDLVEHALVGVFQTTLAGDILYVNDTVLKMFEFDSVEELVAGGVLVRYKDPKARQLLLDILKNEGRIGDFEYEALTRTGRTKSLLLSATLANGVLTGMVLDITERRTAEERIKRAVADLERSNKELEQFAYVASHDLQEPLRMVSSYTQLLGQRYEGQLDAKAKKYIDYAVDGAVRMQRLINDLLTYSRVGTRGKPLEPTDVHAVLGEAVANLATAIAEGGAMVTNDDLPTVRTDASQLVQVFQNLIGNAIKFRGTEPPRVHVSARDTGGEWEFSVRDNGIGIEPEFAERVFVIFQRLHTREEYPGTGIGLALSKRIIERHGGRIWFESEPGTGSTFFFTVPKRDGGGTT